MCLSLADDAPQVVAVYKGGQRQRGGAQFESGVRIRADGAGQIVLLRKGLCLGIESRVDTARIEGFDRIHQWHDFEQVGQIPVSVAVKVKGV